MLTASVVVGLLASVALRLLASAVGCNIVGLSGQLLPALVTVTLLASMVGCYQPQAVKFLIGFGGQLLVSSISDHGSY